MKPHPCAMPGKSEVEFFPVRDHQYPLYLVDQHKHSYNKTHMHTRSVYLGLPSNMSEIPSERGEVHVIFSFPAPHT